jgi:hypothetical protein
MADASNVLYSSTKMIRPKVVFPIPVTLLSFFLKQDFVNHAVTFCIKMKQERVANKILAPSFKF